MNLAQNPKFSSFIYYFLTHGQKQLKKDEKNVLHTCHAWRKHKKNADFRDLYNFEKSLDFCDFLI